MTRDLSGKLQAAFGSRHEKSCPCVGSGKEVKIGRNKNKAIALDPSCLLADIQLSDDFAVALFIVRFQIV
jgi:hypothetical protein